MNELIMLVETMRLSKPSILDFVHTLRATDQLMMIRRTEDISRSRKERDRDRDRGLDEGE